MTNRKRPFYCDVLYKLAKKKRLSCPLGRALYGCNRRQNGWPRDHENILSMMDDLDFLRTVCHETAVKWLKHWNSGGSIKSLRSRKDQLELNRVRDNQRRAHYRRLGLT